MSVKYAPSKLKVPPGFQNLLEGLSREVLRMQPDGHQAILEFAAEYFRGQQIRRDATGRDDAEKGKFMEQLARGETVNKVPPQHAAPPSDIRLDASTGLLLADKSAAPAPAPVEEEIDIDLTDPDVEKAANKIQAVFRRKGSPSKKPTESPLPVAAAPPEVEEKAKEEAEEAQSLTEDEAAVKIQALARGNKSRHEVQALRDSMTEVTATEVSEATEATTEATEEEMENAAIKIQSQIRGKLAKNEVARMKEAASATDASAPDDEPEPEEHAIDEAEHTVDEAEAATKIQAVVRGHQARESVKSMTTGEGAEDEGVEDEGEGGEEVADDDIVSDDDDEADANE